MSTDLSAAITQLDDLVKANEGVGDDFCPYIQNGAWTLGGMRALLAALGWRPIETAPQNYTPIILLQDGHEGEGWYSNHLRCWEFATKTSIFYKQPTHWRPLRFGLPPRERTP